MGRFCIFSWNRLKCPFFFFKGQLFCNKTYIIWKKSYLINVHLFRKVYQQEEVLSVYMINTDWQLFTKVIPFYQLIRYGWYYWFSNETPVNQGIFHSCPKTCIAFIKCSAEYLITAWYTGPVETSIHCCQVLEMADSLPIFKDPFSKRWNKSSPSINQSILKKIFIFLPCLNWGFPWWYFLSWRFCQWTDDNNNIKDLTYKL